LTDKHFMWSFFNPSSVAVVGARSSPGFGYGIPLWLREHGHGDKVWLVNPKGGNLHSYTVYKSIREVPVRVELAVVITPAPVVPGLLLEIAEAGVRNVIIESAGFAETGPEGKELQDKCRAIAVDKGLRVMGPNCVGVVNTENRFATSEVIDTALKPGPIGVVAQSGVFGSILLDCFPSKDLAISRSVTLGNRLIVDESDVLDFYREDPMTEVVLMYLEGAADGAKLRNALRRTTALKPVIVLKSGRTEEGGSATGSHTGSMAGRDDIYDGLFSQTGVIRAEGVGDMLDLAAAFARQPLPRGNRLCVLTTSGSMGAVSIDAAVERGLAAARLGRDTVASVRKQAPAWMNVRNPLDVGPSGIFRSAFEAILDDPGVDMALLFPTIPYSVVEVFGRLGVSAGAWLGNLGEIRKRAEDKPVVAAAVGHPDWFRQLREICANGITLVEYPENAAAVLAALWRYSAYRKSFEESAARG